MNQQPKITLRNSIHKNQNVVCIEFPFNVQINDVLRKNTTATWSKGLGCWYMAEPDFNLNKFFNQLSSVAFINYSVLKNKKENAESVVQRTKYAHRHTV